MTSENLCVKGLLIHRLVIHRFSTRVMQWGQWRLSTELMHMPLVGLIVDKTLILGCLLATYMWISPPGVVTMGACFLPHRLSKLRGYPCQWNFGSSAWSFCAMSCLPSNFTPGFAPYRP